MIRKIVISMTLLQLADVYSQKTIPVDLVKLSKITLAESPIVKQNILTISVQKVVLISKKHLITN